MADVVVTGANSNSLASVFSFECIGNVPGDATKESAIEQLLQFVANAGMLSQQQVPTLLGRIMDRERAGSTALGRGLAIPHLLTDAVSTFVGAVGLAPEGVDFQSIDGISTKLIFLVLGPFHQDGRHFELLGRLWALMRDRATLMFLQGCRTPSEVFQYLVELDARSGA